MKKNISILGSTGSIWTQTLDVIREHSEIFEVYAISANSNIEKLFEQIKEFNPKKVVVFDEKKAEELRKNVWNAGLHSIQEPEIFSWINWLIDISEDDKTDILVTSVVWAIWLEPTVSALKKWKIIALANKETLVVAGEEIQKLVKKYWWEIRPVDSEHSAIWQCLKSGKKSEVKKIWLTASWWPFLNKEKWTKEKIKNAKISDALNHPTWKMWKKISIDSATLANKWLEFIEAVYLFDLKPEQIEVVVHPQSIVHSAVEFNDGSIIAELWATDMKRAISYALFWEKRPKNSFKTFSFFDQNLTFEKPDRERFPCLSLAEKAARHSQEACKIFNDTNEIAVAKFLGWEIGFGEIGEMIEGEMGRINNF